MALVQFEARTKGRRWAVLAPFLQKAEYDAMLVGGNNFHLWDEESQEEAWRRALAAGQSVPAYVEGATAPLTTDLEAVASDLQRRDVFQREYARKAEVRLGTVPLASLISPQVVADMDYVDELATRLGAEPNPLEDFAFAFPLGAVPDPLVSGQTVIFNDQTQNILIQPVAEWRRAGDEVEISVRAASRPNYVWVAEMGSRLVLLNGVHKVLAALKAGRTALPAVVRTAASVPELGLQQPPTFLAHIEAVRPPLVSDFFHAIAIAVGRRPTRTLTRLIVQVDQIPVPE